MSDEITFTIDAGDEAENIVGDADSGIVMDEEDNSDKAQTAEEEAKIKKTADSIGNQVKAKLSPAEQKKIEEAKKKDVTSAKLDTAENFSEYDLSDKEMKDALSLASEFMSFAKDKVEIEPNSGKIETLPSGIDVLDAILGGGFGLGTLAVIAGNPGTFKSSLLGQVMGNSQKKFKGKMLSAYLDSENSMTIERLYQLGVTSPPIKPYSDITVEGIFKTIEAMCAFKAVKDIPEMPSIVGWDSVANTTTDYEKADSETSINSVIGLRARILSFVLPRYVSKLRNNNMSLIAINQLRDNISMGQFTSAPDLRWMGDKNMPGGNALKFNAFHLLLLKIKGDLKFEQWGFNGIILEAKCIKNKLFRPNIPVQLIVDFNTGISNFWTNYHIMKTNNYIEGAAWQKLKAYPEFKWQSTKGCLDKYEKDEAFKKAFDDSAKMCIQNELIEPNKGIELPEDLLK